MAAGAEDDNYQLWYSPVIILTFSRGYNKLNMNITGCITAEKASETKMKEQTA